MRLPFPVLVLISLGATVATAQVRINEFMARNQTTLPDEDGDHEDWIELHNPTGTAVDLAGWTLTDDVEEPSMWAFPSVSLAAGEYLVVFASGKDRHEANGELHTNFRLSTDGEYLALARPDGAVAQSFAPAYPGQVADISYGQTFTITNETVLLGSGTTARAHVPSSNGLGDSWKLAGFNDTSWPAGLLGAGYERSPGGGVTYTDLLGLDLDALMFGENQSAYVRVRFQVADPLSFRALTLQMRYDDGFAAFLNGVPVAAANAPDTLDYQSAALEHRPGGDAAAVEFEDFDISTHLDALVAGTNVLAIHLLNDGLTSSDALCFPQLKAAGAADTGLSYMNTPTPGAANSAGNEGKVADTKFSVDRGYHDLPFQVAITTATPGATIRYTTDGSPPDDSIGTVYSGPLSITGTTVLRAVAVRPGYLPSNVDTQTYLFPDQVMTQDGRGITSAYWGHDGPDWEMDPEVLAFRNAELKPTREDLLSLPALSIVMDWDTMFGPGGIYISGEGVERPCSAELIDPSGGGNEFQVNASINVFGGTSVNRWKTDKLSMRLKFKEPYGPTKLRHPVFGPDGADEFDTLVIDARLNNVWHYAGGVQPDDQQIRGQYVRDQVVADMQTATGGLAPRGEHVLVYINGILWGIHTLHERPDDSFASSYLEGERGEFDALKHNTGDVIGGTNEAYIAMLALSRRDLSALPNYQAVADVVDVTALADYILVNYFVGNTDWAHHNWYATRKRTAPAGLWRWHSWDAEHSMENEAENVTGKNNLNGPTEVHRNLLASPEYRILFNDRVQRHFRGDGVLTTAGASAIYRARADSVSAAIRIESARWGDNTRATPYTWQDWNNELQRLTQVLIPGRNQLVLQQMDAQGFLVSTPAPVPGHPGGSVSTPITIPVNSPHTVYLTTDGTDPRAYGTGSPAVDPSSGSVTIDRSMVVKARALDGGAWSPLVEVVFVAESPPGLRISEVMFHAHAPEGSETGAPFAEEDYDFVEIHNPGPAPVGLAGLEFSEGIRFDFSTSAVPTLAPDAHAVVVADLEAFQLRHPDVPASRIAGEYQGRLDNSGEGLTLQSPLIGWSYAISFGDNRGWPPQCDGAGHSLVPLAEPPGLLQFRGNWRASTYRGGSPGTADPAPVDEVLINEIAARTDTAVPGFTSDDWVELVAAGGGIVHPADWYLSDDPDHLLKSSCSAPSGAGPRWWSIGEVPSSGSRLLFGLNGDGETLFLTHAPGGVISRVADAVSFKGQELDTTLGRRPDAGPSLMAMPPTRGAANSDPRPDIRIHELLYRHASGPAFDYVVLHNPLPTAVPLFNAAGSWRIDGSVHWNLPLDTIMDPNSFLTLVFFDPSDPAARNAFLTAHGLAEDQVRLAGPCDGTLPDVEGRIRLERPQSGDGLAPPDSWVVIDEASWFAADPFPDSAAGTGLALHRIAPDAAGTLAASWQSGLPSPATTTVAWPDIQLGIAGTSGTSVDLRFILFPGLTYTLETTPTLAPAQWQPVTTVTGSGPTIVTRTLDGIHQFYRVRQQE